MPRNANSYQDLQTIINKQPPEERRTITFFFSMGKYHAASEIDFAKCMSLDLKSGTFKQNDRRSNRIGVDTLQEYLQHYGYLLKIMELPPLKEKLVLAANSGTSSTTEKQARDKLPSSLKRKGMI